MTIPFEEIGLEPLPTGNLTTTIEGQCEVDGKIGARAIQIEGDAVVVVTVSEKGLLDPKEGVTVIFSGRKDLKIFLFNAMISWCTMEGDLTQIIAHLLRRHQEEYYTALIEATAINEKEAEHDDRDPGNP